MRSISVLLLMAVVGVDASAQQGLQVTGKVVPTWAWFMNADDEGQMTSGTCFGFGANYHWRDGMGAGIDLIWGTETQVFDPGDGAWTMERSVLKLPVLFHFNSPSADVVPFVGYVGFERVSVRDVAVTGPGGFDPEGVTVNDPNGIGPAFVFHSGELYHKDAWGAVIGLGPGWNINGEFQVSAIIRAGYLLSDPENKDEGTGQVMWQDRDRTTLMTLGIDLGLKYIFQ